MPDRSDEYREAAAECIALARKTDNPALRAELLIMAQKWYDRANGSPINFEAILKAFNDQQMDGR